MKIHPSYIIVIIAFTCMVVSSCKKKEDKLTPTCDGSSPTYDNGISAIINATCVSSSCHGAGSPRGDWTSYATLKPVLDNGAFRRRILEVQDMPKGSSLSQDQLNKIQCWVNNGYPEK